MIQLRKEGWANHLGRQAAACFLTRGCLWVSWEEGFKVMTYSAPHPFISYDSITP